jgi:hypothetical protein
MITRRYHGMITGVYLLEKRAYPQVGAPGGRLWINIDARFACLGKPGIE